MPAELTERQREILEYINRKLDADGVSPTVQEIQWQFGFKSPNAVQSHLLALTKKGYIRRRRREARGLRLVGKASSRNNNGKAPLQAPLSVIVPPVPNSPVYTRVGAASYQNGDGGSVLVFPLMMEPARVTQRSLPNAGDMMHGSVKWNSSSQGLWIPVN